MSDQWLPQEEILMARIIEVTVSPAGEATVRTRGYTGAECLKASLFVEKALGIPSAEVKTAEFYQLCEGSHNWYYVES
jgi:Protein of unknown function (DUF2997)